MCSDVYEGLMRSLFRVAQKYFVAFLERYQNTQGERIRNAFTKHRELRDERRRHKKDMSVLEAQIEVHL